MENTEKNNTAPKFNIPNSISFGDMLEFAPKDGSQVQREVITDTYITASDNEDEMFRQIDSASETLKSKISGFAGYFSFWYLQLTMMYLLKEKERCFACLDKINYGVDAIERHIITGNFLDENGKDTGFRNFSFGESDEQLKQNMYYAVDTYNTARLVHMKASSFESGFAFLVASLILHGYGKQRGMMRDDAINIRKLSEHIREFIKNEKPEDGESLEANGNMSFGSIEDLKTE